MAPIYLPTNAELTALTTKQLIELYNILAPTAPVKKFTDRKTAEARVAKVVEAARATREIEAQMAASAKGDGDLPAEGGKAKKVKATATKEPRVSLSSEIRDRIFAGKTNAEIVNEMKLPVNKKHYPGWFRTKLIREGKLAPKKGA